MVLFVTGFFLYTIIPNYSNKVDREYVEYIDNGIFYYRNKNSNKAIIEFDKAQKIHDDDPVLYENKALAYQRNGNPKEAIETAKKGIECLENNSTYYRVKNHKFILKCNDIGFYRIIGECYLTLKQYDKAEDFYTYIIEHNSSEYTDAYLWRGFCRYKQSKFNAKEDFYQHKQIVDKYVKDQELKKPEYRDLYPIYNQEDINRANNWIKYYK
jgi:tetratricopeptide (TPR) repeat protein